MNDELDFSAAVPLAMVLIPLFVIVRVVNMVRAILGGRV